MIDNAPDAVKKTYLKMKGEQGKKLELKTIGGNYYLYVAMGTWDKKKKKSMKKAVLMGSIGICSYSFLHNLSITNRTNIF